MNDDNLRESENLEDKQKLYKFKSDVSSDADVVSEQTIQANEDMRFINVVGGMWEGWLKNSFDSDRVKLELDIVSDHLQRYLGEWDLNRVGVDFKPDDGQTSDEDADLLNGIYRADFRNFSGAIATDLSVDEAATCGVGAFKLSTVFEDDEDAENENMRIVWVPIANAYNSVVWDQSAQRIDKRDARWCTVLKPFTKDSFEEKYPGKSPVSAYQPNDLLSGNGNMYTPDFVYVATRYEAVKKKELNFIYNNLQTGKVEVYNKEDHQLIKDELRADKFRTFVRQRMIVCKSVEKTVFSGEDILHETRRITGKYIPVIPFYGYRAYVDGVEWYRGLVRKLKDAARLFNMQVSQMAENAASGGQEVPIFTPEQMENADIQRIWADKNNQPYLLAEPVKGPNGEIVQTGPIAYSKPAQLDGSTAALLQIVPNYVQGATGGMPQDTLDPNASGKAINALIQRENLTTHKISKNIADAIEWSGEVYQAMAAEVYSTQRIIRTVGKGGTQNQIQLLKTVMDEETGTLVESNTLKGKKFRAYSDVGPQYESMRQQTVEELKGMLEALQKTKGGEQYTPAILAVLMDNITGTGLDPIKELNRRIMLSQELVKPENEEEEALVQQLQQPKEDPQKGLIEAATNQANSEARNLDAASLEKVANAELKQATTAKTQMQTAQIRSDIGNDKAKLFLDAQKQLVQRREKIVEIVESLPLQ